MDIEPIESMAPRSAAGIGAAKPPTVARIDDGFSKFYEREHDTQVRRAYLILGASGSAHDVVADAFVAVLRRWESIEQPGPYLNRCVLNGCRDAHRRAPREQPSFHSVETIGESSETERWNPAIVDDADEMAEHLLRLPFRQRAAIVMRYYGGYGEAEIAHFLECRPGTVGSLIHRGLHVLRNVLVNDLDANSNQKLHGGSKTSERPGGQIR